MTDNIIRFPATQNQPEYDLDADRVDLRESYVDAMSQEMFRMVSKIIERSNVIEKIDPTDEGQFFAFQNRMIMIHEAFKYFYSFVENVDYDLQEVFETLYQPLDMVDEELTTTIYATVNPKYKERLIEMTRAFNKEQHG